MMDWVKDFYSCQNDWFGVYLSDINQSHQDRVELIEKALQKPQCSVLELGAGGGQTAVALAKSGYRVTMIELLEKSAAHAQKLCASYKQCVKVYQADFYEIILNQQFDIVCYFDSFGIGDDEDQLRLLRKINQWLQPNGKAMIEVGSTWFWANVAHGKTTDLGACMRQYHYDSANKRLLDYWWLKEKPSDKKCQSLRCYTPDEITKLSKRASLKLIDCIAGGKIDFEKMQFVPNVPLKEAMTYYVVLEKIEKV